MRIFFNSCYYLGILAPLSFEMLTTDLEAANFVTLSTDTSNHGNIKMLPIMVRYFSVKSGVQNKLLELVELNNEKADTIVPILKNLCEKYNLNKKVICYAAHNAPVNFGGVTRGGDVNILAQLQSHFENRLVGLGCVAHILHNTVDNACNQIEIANVEPTVVSIYTHFYRNTVRVTQLKEICESVKIEYTKLLGYGRTRFLAFKSCIDKIIKMFEALCL